MGSFRYTSIEQTRPLLGVGKDKTLFAGSAVTDSVHSHEHFDL